jgi:Carboxypeptidase regulatory-like domain
MKFKTFLLFSLALLVSFHMTAFDLLLQGKVTDAKSKKPIEGCHISITAADTLIEIITDKNGKYSIKLPLDKLYEVRYSAKKYFTKIVEMDMRNIPEEDKEGPFELVMDGTMVRFNKKIDAEIFAKPMARCKFEKASNSIEFDLIYTQKRVEEIAAPTQKKSKKKATAKSN